MNIDEFEQIELTDELNIRLVNKEPRTLLYGYTLNNNHTFHVYLNDRGVIKFCHYDYMARGIFFNPKKLEDITASVKRLYPEACDFEFCDYLKRHGVKLPFTTFNLDRETETFYGYVDPYDE